MFGSDLKQLIVLDDLRDKLEMIDSDIIPESETHPIVTGIENVPSSIVSTDGVSYQSTYTTFPLSPLQGRVHYLRDSFLNFSINVSFGIHLDRAHSEPIYLYVGPRDTASIFNQLQLMIDNNVIWNTTYHQIESAIDMAGLPASVVDHSNNYATIDKLLQNKNTPMKLIIIPPKTDGVKTFVTQDEIYTLNYNFTIDLNRLCVPLSNIDFITSNMGNLRLRVYLNNFHESFYYLHIPNSIISDIVPDKPDSPTKYTFTFLENTNKLLPLNPVKWGTTTTAADTTTYTDPIYIASNLKPTITFTSTGGTISDNVQIKDLTKDDFIALQFIKRPQGTTNSFMAVQSADICQTCFDIQEESWNKLCEYFGGIGKVIIPIQAWSTNLFNNGTYEAGNAVDSTLLANVPGNNITDIALTICPNNCQSCILNPYLSNIQALLDGKPLNSVPYNKVDNRAIQDFTNSCVDTDNDEINTDYLYSLQFPPLISSPGSSVSRTNQQYFYNVNTIPDFQYFSNMGGKIGMADRFIKNPNLFMYIFQTAIPCSFHTGMCVIENTNRQALFRLTSSGTRGIISDLNTRFYDCRNQTITNKSSGTYQNDNEKALNVSMPNTTNTSTQFNISCLCDECIVLDYDNVLNTCTGGYISYAKPFVSEE